MVFNNLDHQEKEITNRNVTQCVGGGTLIQDQQGWANTGVHPQPPLPHKSYRGATLQSALIMMTLTAMRSLGGFLFRCSTADSIFISCRWSKD